MASVKFEQVEKAYGDVRIIRGVDLDIVDGEFLVLVGPSGCGKSTMLRCVAGLEQISAGTLSIGARVVNDVAPRDRGVAMVFQSYALYPHMTVRDNMAFGLKIRKAPPAEIDARIADAARLLDIEQYLDRLPKQLSGGQRQRVAIGRAIVRQPDVFLFDEPLSNLDAALRTQMRVELKKLHRDLGTTMIYVTHDQVEAMTLANRIAILRDGLLQQVGTPAEVFERPANRFVASFIGSPSTNFLTVRGDGTRLLGDGFELDLGRDTTSVAEVGIRPQHLDLDSDSPMTLRGRVEVIEPMGWEAYLHMSVGDAPVIAHVRADEIRTTKPGDELTFGVQPERLHLFDADGEIVA